jgi:hypothetical protein
MEGPQYAADERGRRSVTNGVRGGRRADQLDRWLTRCRSIRRRYASDGVDHRAGKLPRWPDGRPGPLEVAGLR